MGIVQGPPQKQESSDSRCCRAQYRQLQSARHRMVVNRLATLVKVVAVERGMPTVEALSSSSIGRPQHRSNVED